MVLHYDPEWEVTRENLNLLEVIGEGAFGKVLKAEAFDLSRQHSGKTIVAVKTLKGWSLSFYEHEKRLSKLNVQKLENPFSKIKSTSGPGFLVLNSCLCNL